MNLPSTITTLGNRAFWECRKMTSVSIPAATTQVGDSAFYDCENLDCVYNYADEPQVLGAKVFQNIKNNATLYVPTQSIDTYANNSTWNSWFKQVKNIPYDVYINGEQITMENSEDFYGHGKKDVSYDFKTNTLTLNNAELTTDDYYEGITSYSNGPTLNIHIIGDCKINNYSSSSAIRSDYRTINIYGGGKLTIENLANSTGIYAEGGLNISNGVTVEINSKNDKAYGISLIGTDLIVDGSTLTVQGYPSFLGVKSLVMSGGVSILSEGHTFDATKQTIVNESGNATNDVVKIGVDLPDARGYQVHLDNYGTDKLAVIKEVRVSLSLGLKEAKDLVDSAPCLLLETESKEKALALATALRALGATITITSLDEEPGEEPGKEPGEEVGKGYKVHLDDYGTNKLAVVKEVKESLTLTLLDAKNLVDSAPCLLLETESKEKALALATALRALGATITIMGLDEEPGEESGEEAGEEPGEEPGEESGEEPSEPDSTTIGTAKATIDGSEVDVKWVQLWENGPKFAEYNVGVTDGKAESYGGYYCWGGSIDKDTETAYKNVETALTGTDDTATNLWGSAWRMPTEKELNNLLDNCDSEWTIVNGVSGRKFTGKGDYASNSVFLPAAGYCNYGYVLSPGLSCYYWSSAPYGSDYAYILYFNSGGQYVEDSGRRDFGYSVRAVLAETEPSEEPAIKGDLNNNDRLDAGDLALMLDCLVNETENLDGDMNGNGQLDAGDMGMLVDELVNGGDNVREQVAAVRTQGAGENPFTMDILDATVGSEENELVFNLTGATAYSTAIYNVTLPEGYTFYFDEDEDDYVITMNIAKPEFTTKLTNNTLRIVAKSGSSKLFKADEGFMKIQIVAAADAKPGFVTISKLQFGKPDGGLLELEDVTGMIRVNGEEPTGISAVAGIKANGAIFDLSGRKVAKLQKGINIINGKKIVK